MRKGLADSFAASFSSFTA